VRGTPRTDTKVGLSDPAVLYGRAVAQRIKGTPGITGLSPPRVHIDEEVWHLKVLFASSPNGEDRIVDNNFDINCFSFFV
jgi:hypothetical protein